MPKVSVIVPVYNVEKYLKECVDSLRNQSIHDIEIILVDDGSPDTCPSLCDLFAAEDSRIKVVHKNNEGLGFARNSGMEVATGEYVAFTDSDDYELKETYETLYKLANDTDSDVVYYQFIGRGLSVPRNCFFKGTDSIKEFMLDMISNPPMSKVDRNNQVSSCLGLYRRSILEKYLIRFHSERELISEDLIFNLDFLSFAHKVAVTSYQFYYYRIVDGSLTHKIMRNRHEKNKEFYLYLTNRIKIYELGNEGLLRSDRLFIGYTRSTIFIILRSKLPLKDKIGWTIDICKDDIWGAIKQEYPYQKLPLKYCLFFKCMCNCYFLPMWVMSKL